MRKYENQVQKIKSDVLVEVARYAFEGNLEDQKYKIPFTISPGPEARYRCCIYHERAITTERVHLAMGGCSDDTGVIQVIESACDQCPVNRYAITEACRGCLAHRCQGNCPVDAIRIEHGRAVIDYSKCVECGKCKESCPYNAVADVMRPCKRECPTGAIQIDHRKKAVIDHDLCIACGACVYNCPFGAMQEKSEIVSVIEALKSNEIPVYAMIAPSFATQFEYSPLGKVVHAIKQLGFKDIVEVALGADLVTQHEAEELQLARAEGHIMTSSCCPGFVNYIHLKYPELKDHISQTVSPMTATARLIKNIDPNAVVVFVGPCIAKKTERQRVPDTDFVITFEELAALIDAKNINLETLEPMPFNNASYFGRHFAASGGVTKAIQNQLKDDTVQIEICDGIEACDKALKRLKFKKLEANFIEGMACKGGCIKGPVTMHHGPKDMKALEAYSKLALETEPREALRVFETTQINLNAF